MLQEAASAITEKIVNFSRDHMTACFQKDIDSLASETYFPHEELKGKNQIFQYQHTTNQSAIKTILKVPVRLTKNYQLNQS